VALIEDRIAARAVALVDDLAEDVAAGREIELVGRVSARPPMWAISVAIGIADPTESGSRGLRTPWSAGTTREFVGESALTVLRARRPCCSPAGAPLRHRPLPRPAPRVRRRRPALLPRGAPGQDAAAGDHRELLRRCEIADAGPPAYLAGNLIYGIRRLPVLLTPR
jgi:hypothetical protein